MANSMTGFGRAEIAGETHTMSVEIKSVNHRFKDYRFKMPYLLNVVEMDLRKKLDGVFARGSFDIYVQFKKSKLEDELPNIDYKKIKAFIDEFNKNSGVENSQIQVRPVDFLKNEFYQDLEESQKEAICELALKTFEMAMEELQGSRAAEGKKLVQVLIKQLGEYEKSLDKVVSLKDLYQKNIKEKLQQRFKENAQVIDIDDVRFNKEIIYYLERLDIDEEIERAKIHCGKLKSLLEKQLHEKGRKIEFLLQELNRETNTIGSKSAHEEISNAVVNMKVHLEKMREQSLNLE
ncbi:MAG: YicC family protein [Halobacteriovoraceae bacterium]|nr:YicC family protein [Halobacteriovoraceae bacterium]MCB9095433.1 YicC family protein [Halobacteriovoraceae bacterium]